MLVSKAVLTDFYKTNKDCPDARKRALKIMGDARQTGQKIVIAGRGSEKYIVRIAGLKHLCQLTDVRTRKYPESEMSRLSVLQMVTRTIKANKTVSLVKE